ncbi:MAG: endonuclease [Candidatus Zambryskibacteria bacterium CG22_combo_CG10-13_8_21_14_all_42_17]|uniref:Endonuclease n=1 Tax=Candidatus Zambryskibacteria bacterium CG22_combo_CG10-13_8_21_14_all_42_17 TaxID=1975118 RepID=A0A2H0BEW0_9BACT|nr:MAG: endonuclease [Candidatus Zambryskibacteria bacterium CG22_combo_CG10-13_8_21_14_all_42_17]
MYFVYIIYNEEADKFYIGQTDDLEQRIIYHNTHEFNNSYTSRFAGHWNVIYKESYSDRTSSLKREKQLKSFQGRQFIKKLLPR